MVKQPPKIKICGQTRLQDISFSFQSGADYCGVVIEVPSSPRSLTVAAAKPLFMENGRRMAALTAHAGEPLYKEIAQKLAPGFFQLTANETPEEAGAVAKATGIPVFKSLHLPTAGNRREETELDFLTLIERYLDAGCEGFVLDTRVPGQYGGSGIQSDWGLAAKILAKADAKIFLAGGISPENAPEAVALGPYGIDLASGVEISPGVKSREKIAALFAAIRNKAP